MVVLVSTDDLQSILDTYLHTHTDPEDENNSRHAVAACSTLYSKRKIIMTL